MFSRASKKSRDSSRESSRRSYFPTESGAVLGSLTSFPASRLGGESRRSSRESRPSRLSSTAVFSKVLSPAFEVSPPSPSRLEEKLSKASKLPGRSKVSSVEALGPTPPPRGEKVSRELSWPTAEVKKAGGSWGVGAGRIDCGSRREGGGRTGAGG